MWQAGCPGGSSDNFQVSRQIRSKSLSRSHGVKTHRCVRASRAQLQSHRKRPLAPATGAPWACLAAPNKRSSQVTSEGRCCCCQRRAPPPQRGCDRRAILSLWRLDVFCGKDVPTWLLSSRTQTPARSQPPAAALQALALEPPRPPRPQDRPRCAGGGQAARAECHSPLRQGSGGGGVVSSSAPSVSTVCLAVLPQGGAALPRGRAGRGPSGSLPRRTTGATCWASASLRALPAWRGPVPKPRPLFPPGRRSTAPWTRAPRPRARRPPHTSSRPWARMTPRTTSLCARQVSAAAGRPGVLRRPPAARCPEPGPRCPVAPGGQCTCC